VNEHYAYEPNGGGLERWPSQLKYEDVFSTFQERTQPVNYLRWPAWPFDGASALNRQVVLAEPTSHAPFTFGTQNIAANPLELEWNARGHRVVRIPQNGLSGLNTATGIKFACSGSGRLVDYNSDFADNWFVQCRFKVDTWDANARTVWGFVDKDSLTPPQHRYQLQQKGATPGTFRVTHTDPLTSVATHYDFSGFTHDSEDYYEVGVMRWYLDASRDWLLVFNHGIQNGGFYRPKKCRLYVVGAVEIGRRNNGKSNASFDGRIAAFNLWRDPLRTKGSNQNYEWIKKGALDPWWHLRGPDYPYEDLPPLPSVQPCFHASLTSQPAISASARSLARMGAGLSSQLAVSASSRSRVAVAADVRGPSGVDGDVSSRERLKSDVRGRARVTGDPWGSPRMDADARVRERLKGDVWSRPAMSGSVSSRPAVTGDVGRC
jgi:hypothetical protein